MHFSGQGDSHARQRVYFSSKITETVEYNAEKMKTFIYPDTLKINAKNTEAQDMFYQNGYLYFILAEKDENGKEFTKSHILKYRYEDCVCVGHDTFTNEHATKFEIESMHIDSSNNLIFSANENKEILERVKVGGKTQIRKKILNNRDDIYIVKKWALATKIISNPKKP